MHPEERVREYCLEFARHGFEHREYLKLLDGLIMRDELTAVPAIVTIINEFDPTSPQNSGLDRGDASYAAEILLGSLDSEFRLRAFETGRRAIDAVRRAVDRMRNAHYESAPDEGERSKRIRYQSTLGILKELQGNNNYDKSIQDTLELKHQITLSESELLAFCNYLISQDPRYPTWSETDWHVDLTREKERKSPWQYRIIQNIEPFYKAYLKYKQEGR
jgi:hypothetical protein